MQFTQEQRDATRAMRPLVCVSAGAGSGKTTILIERIAQILDRQDLWPDGRPQLDRIAAITFTEAAAAEMKARLRRKFREYASQDDRKQMTFWRNMERQVEGTRITTIHSFCASLLREYALHIGMDPDWKVMTDADAAQLMESIIDQTLHSLLEGEDADTEDLAVALGIGPLKQALTDVLRDRWKYQKSEANALYDNPEALFQRWKSVVQELCDNTLHQLREAGVIGEHLNALESLAGCCPDPTDKKEVQRVLFLSLLRDMEDDVGDLPQKIRDTIDESNFSGGSKKKWGEENFALVKDALNAARDFLKDQCSFPEFDDEFERCAAVLTCKFHKVSVQVLEGYKQARQTAALVDFDDMINEALQLLRENPGLRQRAARDLRFLLIDEFQDTDRRQLEVAHLLAGEEKGPDLFIVGDAKQSIYLFRGAEVSLFKEELKKDANAIALPDNYRSLPEVIQFINSFFERSDLLQAVERYTPMQVSRAPMGSPRVELFVPLPEEEEKRKSVSEENEQEAQYIARRIREMCDGAKPLQLREDKQDGALRNARYDDIVLLFRRGTHIYAYESALRDAGIPYNRIAGEGYFKRREIEDVLSLLKLLQDPWDGEMLLTVLRSPLAGLSDESLMRLAQIPGGLVVAFHSDVVPERFEDTEPLQRIRGLFKKLYARRESSPGVMLRQILEATHFEAVLLSQHLGLQRASNLRKLVQMADEFGNGRAATLAEFTHYVEEMSVREIREGEAMLPSKGMGAVTLMTIHKSKGLEFPVVFIPEMWVASKQQNFGVLLHHDTLGFTVKTPDEQGNLRYSAIGEIIKGLREKEETAELARILYVAMTRAKDYLVLCSGVEPPKKSWAEVLNPLYDLEGREDGEVIQEKDFQATVRREIPESLPKRKGDTENPAFDFDAINTAIQPVQIEAIAPESISVSRLLSLLATTPLDDADVEPEQQLDHNEDAVSLGRETAMERGTLVHRMFELWDFAKDRLPDMEMLLNEAGLGLDQRETAKTSLENIAARFRASEYMKLFAQAGVVLRETPFILPMGEVLVHGVIDVLLDTKVIVDYKTGKPKSELERHYADQMRLYAAALRNITGNTPEKAVLWYADYGEAHTIEMSDDNLDDVLARARKALEL
jgi:ATP-dependent helicase/nuclease subunit A